jgi:hypothetical protein
MLWTIVAVLLILWAVMFFALHMGGAAVHLLVVAAIVMIIVEFLRGRPPTPRF